jgi:hypothetical protein
MNQEKKEVRESETPDEQTKKSGKEKDKGMVLPIASQSGIFTIQQKSNSRFLDAHEIAAKDFAVVTRLAQNDATQAWVLTGLGGDAYHVRQLSNGRFLDAHEIATKDFAVVTRPAQDNDSQRWVFAPVVPGSGVFTIRQLSNGRLLDAHEIATKDFASVTRTVQNDDTQRWLLKEVATLMVLSPRASQVSSQEFSANDERLSITIVFNRPVAKNTVVVGRTLIVVTDKDQNAGGSLVWMPDARSVTFRSTKSVSDLLHFNPDGSFQLKLIGTDTGNGSIKDLNGSPLDGNSNLTPGGDFETRFRLVG